MFNKNLVEIQKGCKSTCVIVLQEDINKLENSYRVEVDTSESNMLVGDFNRKNLEENLEKIAKNSEIAYLIVEGVDKINGKKQEKYVDVIKDREFRGYKLPDNVIICFTLTDKNNLKTISPEIMKFSKIAC